MDERVLTPELAKELFGPRDLNVEPEPEPVEGLAPRSKPVSEYSDEERDAQARHTLVLRQREREEEQRQREQAEAERTPAQREGDAVSAALTPGAKRAANRGLIDRLHPDEGEGLV